MLYYLQQRKGDAKPDENTQEKKKKKEIDPFDSNEFDESANLNDIEDYMEMLYEDTALKIKGKHCGCQNILEPTFMPKQLHALQEE